MLCHVLYKKMHQKQQQKFFIERINLCVSGFKTANCIERKKTACRDTFFVPLNLDQREIWRRKRVFFSLVKPEIWHLWIFFFVGEKEKCEANKVSTNHKFVLLCTHVSLLFSSWATWKKVQIPFLLRFNERKRRNSILTTVKYPWYFFFFYAIAISLRWWQLTPSKAEKNEEFQPWDNLLRGWNDSHEQAWALIHPLLLLSP